MKRAAILAAIFASISGCARSDVAPSYLGLPGISDADAEENPPEEMGSAPLKHVSSSRVLGAMAYHKVTGRTIDPARLKGGH